MKKTSVCSRLFICALAVFSIVLFPSYANGDTVTGEIPVIAPPCNSCIIAPPDDLPMVLIDTILYRGGCGGKVAVRPLHGEPLVPLTDTTIFLSQYFHQSSVTVGPYMMAVADDGYYFVRWSDGSTNGTRNDIFQDHMSMSRFRRYVAYFQKTSVIEDNRITGSFDDDWRSEYSWMLTPAHGWELEQHNLGTCQAIIPGCYTVNVTENREFKFNLGHTAGQTGNKPEDVRFTQNNIEIEAGKDYELRFMARSVLPRTVVVSVDLVSLLGMPASNFGSANIEEWEVSLTPEMTEYTKTIFISYDKFILPPTTGPVVCLGENPSEIKNCPPSQIVPVTCLGEDPQSKNCPPSQVIPHIPSMSVSLSFNSGHESVTWYLSDVILAEPFQASQQQTNVKPSVNKSRTNNTSAWSVKRSGGSLQLTGTSNANAMISFYDMRGKLVHRVSKQAGSQQTMMINTQRVPAGTYLMVVRSMAGGELFRSKVTLAK